MGKIAFLFPGQGSQSVGMGQVLASCGGDIETLFAEMDQVVGYALSTLMFQGPLAKLTRTENTQPALVATALAAHRLLVTRVGLRPDYVAGHSLGEYAAISVAGGFSFADAVRLVRLRGLAMCEAVPPGEGGMAAMLNMKPKMIAAICQQAVQEIGGICVPANFNTPVQVVISGHKPTVQRALTLAKEKGAKRCMPLAVSAPFHCALMQPAAEKMAVALEKTTIRDLTIPLVANVTALEVQDGTTIRQQLVDQVTGAVLWENTIRRLLELGVETFIELGSGRVLTGMMKRIDKSARALAINGPEDLDKVRGLV